MSKAKLTGVRLSSNPQTQVIDFKGGIGGKINVDKNGVAFFLIEITEAAGDNEFVMNPSRAVRTVRAKATDNGVTPVLDAAGQPIFTVTPEQFLAGKGKLLTGGFHSNNVQPYDLNGRTLSTYTTYVDGKENPVTVFARAGHPIMVDGELLTVAGAQAGSKVNEPQSFEEQGA